MPETTQRLIGSTEVAHLTGVSITTLKRQRKAGHPLYAGKAIRTGGKLAWKYTDVIDYIDNLPYENEPA